MTRCGGFGAITLGVMAMAAAVSTPADAQTATRRGAFAAAEAYDRSQHVCIAEALETARTCAINKCRTAGGFDCRVTAACAPAGWSGQVGIKLQGSQLAVTMCGVASRPGIIVRLKHLCRDYRSRNLETCELAKVWTPQGVEELPAIVWNRRTLGWPNRAMR